MTAWHARRASSKTSLRINPAVKQHFIDSNDWSSPSLAAMIQCFIALSILPFLSSSTPRLFLAKGCPPIAACSKELLLISTILFCSINSLNYNTLPHARSVSSRSGRAGQRECDTGGVILRRDISMIYYCHKAANLKSQHYWSIMHYPHSGFFMYMRFDQL